MIQPDVGAHLSSIMAATIGKSFGKKRDYPRNCKHRGEQSGWQDAAGEPGIRFRIWPCARFNKDVTWEDCRDSDKAHSCATPKDD